MCSLAGCLFERNLKCQYGLTCSQAFSSLDLLKDHIDRAHATAKPSKANVDSAAVLAGVSCKCTVDKCG